MYIEAILPLPIYSTFTYHIPDGLKENVKVGSRVLVQFGRKKFYTAIVTACHSQQPKDFEAKDIISVLDAEPIIRYPQLKLWNWMADYYLCSPGDAYKAAVPTGLKPESETFVSLNEEYEADPDAPFTPTQQQEEVIQLLRTEKRLKISQIEDKSGIPNLTRVITPLLEHELLHIDEKVIDNYKPKKKKFIEITFPRGDTQSLHNALDKVKRSEQQERLLLAWLDASGWLTPAKAVKPVEKDTLLGQTGVSAAILAALVKKGIFQIATKHINRYDASQQGDGGINLSPLSDSQKNALKAINDGFREKPIQLLHGVTGSGKTEIYTHLIADCLRNGNQALFLVPEISLTTQLTQRLRNVFGNRLLVYHSKFSDSERVDIWRRLLTSVEPLVIIGVRSSVLLPFSRLGIVVIDEEHEASYKQYDPAPRYNARDTAMMLAKMHGAKTLLGSATPSVETYYKASTGKYGLVTLNERYENAALPEVEVVDMKDLRKKKEVKGILSGPLRKRLADTIKSGKQAILFQNRRGFAPVVVCGECAWSPKCRNCDVSLIYHKNAGFLRCHYCGYSIQLPKLCPACGQNTLNIYGYGTERISEEIQGEFPDARVARMDLDTTRNKNAYAEIIDDFGAHKTDILVGTQMVSKGLDFGDVTTVGILNADTILNHPDFRSNERAFNMMEQVAGRAGRRAEKGEVLIQTANPDNDVLRFVKQHDYHGYYAAEIVDREKYAYPPFTKIIIIYIKNKDREVCSEAAVTFAMALRSVFGARVLGPEKPYISRIATYYLETIMLKVEAGVSMKKVKDILRYTYASVALKRSVKSSIIYYDVDPM